MREITLDLRPFEEREALHQYLREMLDLSDYYGANLDALHDELTSDQDDMLLMVFCPAHPEGKMAYYLPCLYRVLEESARENRHLKVAFRSVD